MALSVFTYLRAADNLIATATLKPLISQEAGGHPISNVSELPISKVWRSTDSTDARIHIGLASSKEVNFVALINHNLTPTAQITVVGAENELREPSDIFTGTDLAACAAARDAYFSASAPANAAALAEFQANPTLAIVLDPAGEDNSVWQTYAPGNVGAAYSAAAWRNDASPVTMRMPRTPRNAWVLLDVAHSRRYWLVSISDTADSDKRFHQVGYIMIGRARALPQNFQPGWGRSPFKIIRKTDSEISTPIIGRTVATGYRLDFEFLLDRDDTVVLEDLLDSLDAEPLFVVPDPSQRHGFFVRIADAQNPWTTNVGVDNGPNQVEVSLLTDNEGTDI